MKKFLSLLLTAVLCCSLVSTAFAASGDYTFSVQTEGSPAVGDTITVTLELSKNGAEEFDLYAMQDYVRFDPTYFTYVDQSLSVYTVKNGEQERAVFSASPLDFDEDGVIDRVYVNRASTNAEKVSSGVQVMQFQLRVKAQGSTALTQSGVEIFQDPADMDTYRAPDINVTVRATGSSGSTGGGSSSDSKPPKDETPKSETKPDGTVVETTTSQDGTVTRTESKTETKTDGSKVETTKKTVTKKDGTTTSAETTRITDAAGSTGITRTATDEKGHTTVEAEAKVSAKAVEKATAANEPVVIPVEIQAADTLNSAATVRIDIDAKSANSKSSKVKVEIPVTNATSGTVAVLVHADGTEEIVKTSIPTADGIQLKLEGSATVKIVDNSKDFIDTRNHWSREEVNFVASREMFNGVGNRLFGVKQNTTRGMVNTVLARLAGVDTNGGATWYDKGNEWAKQNGVSDGTNPTAAVTREQLATMLYRFAGSPAVSGTQRYADADKISSYAQDAMLWATQVGIISGVGNNLVNPNGNAERAQVAAMFARYLKYIA